EYTTPIEAYRGSWYPGMEHPAPRTLRFEADNFFDIQRAIRFVV
ncbi:MAG: peptide ABC transporter, partial [Mesorhizobium sp.]